MFMVEFLPNIFKKINRFDIGIKTMDLFDALPILDYC